jgi:hypothetical protein
MKRAKRDAQGSIKLISAGVAAAASVLLTSAPAHAEDARAMIGAYAGYLFGATAEGESDTIVNGTPQHITSKASIEGAPSYGAVIDLAVRRGAYAELSYSRSQSEVTLRFSDGSQPYKYDLLQQHVQIGGMLEFKTPKNDWFRPIFGGTVGTTIFSADNNGFDYSEGALSVIFEGGVNLHLTRILGVRLRARGLGTFLTDDSALLCVGGACAYAYTGTVMLQAELGAGVFLAF